MINVITHPVFLWIVGIILGSGILFWLVSCFIASYLIYNRILRKTDAKTWSRELPEDIDPIQVPMYRDGIAWSEENQEYKKDVHIVNEGFNLYGEYYDFGKSRCAIILSGRTECLIYGYYFAIPYAKNDCNVLVIDPRAHGLSDGEFNTLGYEEHKDVIAWINYIRESFKIESFILHGICIGAAGGMYALDSQACPDCVDGIVTEGMFAKFRDSVKNHIKERRRPSLLTVDLVSFWMKRYTGYSMKKGPIDVIENVKTPLLMLHSKEDIYSTPKYAQRLYERSGAKSKRLVWFEHGRHSMLRVTDTQRYDTAISEFLAELASNKSNNENKATVNV